MDLIQMERNRQKKLFCKSLTAKNTSIYYLCCWNILIQIQEHCYIMLLEWVKCHVFDKKKQDCKAICWTCSKLTRKTPERRYWRHSDVFIVNFAWNFVNFVWNLRCFMSFLLLTFDMHLMKSTALTHLAHFYPMILFYTSWKHQKTKGFLVFSGGTT